MAKVTKTKRITFVTDLPKVCELAAQSLGLTPRFELVSKRGRPCPTYDVTVTGSASRVQAFMMLFSRVS